MVKYDKYGRIIYDPEFHDRHFKHWSEEDVDYLREWYGKISPDEIGFALGRTTRAVEWKASKIGVKATKHHKRMSNRTIGKGWKVDEINI